MKEIEKLIAAIQEDQKRVAELLYSISEMSARLAKLSASAAQEIEP